MDLALKDTRMVILMWASLVKIDRMVKANIITRAEMLIVAHFQMA